MEDTRDMANSEYRWQVVRGCVILLAIIICAFLWISVLSFDPLDCPSPHAWPHPMPANNAAGGLGAWVAYRLFMYFGAGTYAAVAGLTVAIGVLARQGRLPSLWQRVLGIGRGDSEDTGRHPSPPRADPGRGRHGEEIPARHVCREFDRGPDSAGFREPDQAGDSAAGHLGRHGGCPATGGAQADPEP
jgi:hypothetical protein